MPKCRACGHVAEKLSDLRAHHKEANHPKIAREPRNTRSMGGGRRSKRPGPHDEGSVITSCSHALESAKLDESGMRRVMTYLYDRFMPSDESADG